MTGSGYRNAWPAWLHLNGFVLRSPDIKGYGALEVERMCGFQFGLFREGVALYRIDDGIVQQFLAAPERALHMLDMYPVGFNNERGPRDWDAIEIASYYGDARYNGYSDERIGKNAAYFSPSATRLSREDEQKVLDLRAELLTLYAYGGFIAKILFRSQRPKNRAPHEVYPPGGGIREYQLMKRQTFRYVTSLSGDEVCRGTVLDW